MENPPKTRDPASPSVETVPRIGKTWFSGPITDLSRISVPSFWFIVLGCSCILAFGGFGHDLATGMREIARWLIIAGGILTTGCATGFLFAIPRTLQREREAKPSRSAVVDASAGDGVDQVDQDELSSTRTLIRYTVNSNLEQISDWLTKIIVGVGLVDLHKLPGLASRAARFLAGGLDSNAQGRAFALGLILYFGVLGFVAGYVTTRVYLTGAFVRAENDNDRVR